jgi:hypothetical protein
MRRKCKTMHLRRSFLELPIGHSKLTRGVGVALKKNSRGTLIAWLNTEECTTMSLKSYLLYIF